MLSTNFYVIQTDNGEVIRDVKSMLRINIHQLERVSFTPNPAELQFYSTYTDGTLAFETVNIKDYLRPIVASALMWYAQHIGHPDMQISTKDPRTAVKTDLNIS